MSGLEIKLIAIDGGAICGQKTIDGQGNSDEARKDRVDDVTGVTLHSAKFRHSGIKAQGYFLPPWASLLVMLIYKIFTALRTLQGNLDL